MSDTVTVIKQERAKWLADLRADLSATEDQISRGLEMLANLREKRDETKATIRELTPRKPRNGDAAGTVGVAVTEGEASA